VAQWLEIETMTRIGIVIAIAWLIETVIEIGIEVEVV
jgi:hypothetical protein